MTEAELQAEIVSLCKQLGLLTFHHADSRRSQSGWPDLVIIGWHGARFAELKSADGRRSLAQIACARQLEEAGLAYRLWRPADWPDIITRELESIR